VSEAAIDLGKRMHTQAFALRGRLSEDDWRRFLADCTAALGMSAAGEAGVWRYPTEDGKGGVGMTFCQPITESFIALDTWPDHDGAYLLVASCRSFRADQLIEPIYRFGLERHDMTDRSTLRL